MRTALAVVRHTLAIAALMVVGLVLHAVLVGLLRGAPIMGAVALCGCGWVAWVMTK